MLVFNQNGIYCPQAGVYIDPWNPVEKAIITHAHADHARPGMGSYLAHKHTTPVLHYRLGEMINVQSAEYGETFFMNGVRISLHPSGHIWGAAQIRLEHNGEVWVVSGDYKLRPDPVAAPFELLRCHHFVTESTFGLPIYRFAPSEEQHEAILHWWKKKRDDGRNSVLLVYALGKAQRVLSQLDTSIGEIYTHGAIHQLNRIYETHVGPLPAAPHLSADIDRKNLQGALILAPPSVAGTNWLRKLQPYRLGICSGWMQLRGTRRRKGADRGFTISDHADWNELNTVVRETGAEKVYVTHGYKSLFAKWLRGEGFDAREAETLFSDSGEPENNINSTDDESVQ